LIIKTLPESLTLEASLPKELIAPLSQNINYKKAKLAY
jgi:hypothetical protein